MHNVYLACLTIAMLFLTTTADAALYVKYGQDGTAKFSDEELPGYVLYSPNANTNSFKSSESKNIVTPVYKTTHNKQSMKANRSITVQAPSQQETIRSNNGNLLIAGAFSEKLEPHHSIQLYIDEQVYGEAQKTLTFNVEGIDRGEHTLKLALLSESGKIIALSEPTTFYMHRNHVNRAN